MCVPGCRRYVVEFEIQVEDKTERGQTNVMACSKQHAILLIQEEIKCYLIDKRITKILRAWLEDDGFPTEIPYRSKEINTLLEDSPF